MSLWGKHRVTETPGVTGAGKIRRALCYSQPTNLHGRECGSSPGTKLNQRRIGIWSSILTAGQQQNLSLSTLLLRFLQYLMPLLRDASEMQRSGLAGGAGRQRRMHRVSAYLSQRHRGKCPRVPWPARDTRQEGMSWRDVSLTSCPERSVSKVR